MELDVDPFSNSSGTVINAYSVDVVDDDAAMDSSDGGVQFDTSGVPSFNGTSSSFQVFETYTATAGGNPVEFTLIQYSTHSYFVVTSGTLNNGDTLSSISNTSSSGPSITYTSMPSYMCFTAGAHISTPSGPIRAERLRPGDSVCVYGKPPQIVRWIGQRTLQKGQILRNPKLAPVRIPAGVLGHKMPQRDILVSRQHRILVSSKIVSRMADVTQTLIPAIKLTQIPGIETDYSLNSVTYVHLMFDAHEIVFAEGAPCESLHPGPEALRSAPKAARDELFALFPELQDPLYRAATARPLLSGRQQKQLVARHAKNDVALLDTFCH